ncbi:MAG: response regulator [Gemmatimonadaceae bacterium]
MFHDRQPPDSQAAAPSAGVGADSRTSERRFQTLIESALDAIVILDAQGVVRYVNPATRHVLGFPANELLGARFIAHVHEDDQEALADSLRAVVAGGRGHHVDLAFRSQTRAGFWRLHDASLRNLLDEPDVSGVVLTARPFDGADEVLERLNQSQRIEALARLAGGVAHDYNNLLTVVTANAQMLLTAPDLDDETRAAIEDIGVAANRAAELTRQLLAFSRQQTLRLEPVALVGLLRGLEDDIRIAVGADVTVTTDFEPVPMTVLGDARQLQLVVMHLVRNARDAMPTGGHLRLECVRIALSAEQAARHAPMTPGTYVRLRVSDTGFGMDAATRARAFEPFFTTKERGKSTGLGLAMAYGVVKQLGGFIWIDSVPGAGSAFTVYLPASSNEAAQRGQAAAAPRRAGAKERILLVEDEELVRRMAKRTLERVGYQVTVARSAEEALQLSRGGLEVDLLLSDIVMPGMNGRELARLLADERPSMRILLMSGYAHVRAAFEGHVDDTPFLQKPFTVEQLLSRVRDVLSVDATTAH